ncbi:MAG: class I SAM-dependent RNA methyltransferase [Treponema sp.]|jgi:putative N6-adenine-specific DNA methylase|nr:class I SAM-dependent RNA methyltransferase [Treponema sp.]
MKNSELTGRDSVLETAAALCAVGAEKVVSNELRKLDLKVLDSLFGRVRFKADTAGLYRSLMGLRAADRVLLEAGFFRADDFDALFEGAAAFPWERLVPKGMGLRVVKVRTNRSHLMAETSIQAVVHKAAAERLCRHYKLARLSDEGAAAEVRVYVEKDMVSLLVDLSGEPLFKRGYRSEGGTAPLRETTAAAMLLLSGWKRKFPLYDPFCGSGTILIEAAMYAWDMAPGLNRRFSLSGLLIGDLKIEESVRRELRDRINFNRVIRIAGSDGESRAVSIAQSNIERLGDLAEAKVPVRGIRFAGQREMPGLPRLKALPMARARPPFAEEAGFIITNPPYGKRLGDRAAAERTYGEMAALREGFPGWKLALITDHPGFESFFGKKAESCREISNGAIPSYFFQYDQL